MKIVYSSKTGNVERFVNKLKYSLSNEFVKIPKSENQIEVNEDYVLITYTTGFGFVPNEVDKFLKYSNNSKFLKAVIGSGNRNWGLNFCKASINIAEQYNVPLLHNFELSGIKEDVDIVTDKIKQIEGNGIN